MQDAEKSKPIVAVAVGDPAGIGNEILLKAVPALEDVARIVAVSDADVLRRANAEFETGVTVRSLDSVSDAAFEPGALDVLDVGVIDDAADVEYGTIEPMYGEAAFAYAESAVRLAMDGAIDAIALGPKHAQSIAASDWQYQDYSDLISDYTETADYAMLVIQDNLRVSHVTMHEPLRDAIDLVTPDAVLRTITLTHDGIADLVDDGAPHIAVAGLNPHAGDGGKLGNEEREQIAPAVEEAREMGIDVTGPISPDSVFTMAKNGSFDGVVAMYHDQGHIPVKLLGEDLEQSGLMLGFPMTVTVVPHGPAFDIAGKGIANEESLVRSIRLATNASSA